LSAKVTVLVPAFNDGRFLEENLRSIAEQGIAELEVVVADDASSDDTPEIARAWANRDPRFRWSRSESNLGMNPNWNRALREATGELVIKLDGDDAFARGCLPALIAAHEQEPDLRFAACRTLDCDERLRILGPYQGDQGFLARGLDPERSRTAPGWSWMRLCFDDIQLWTSDALMFRRLELLQLGGWDERWTSSDTDLILRGLATQRPVAHVPLAGVLYRRRRGSSSERHRQSTRSNLEIAMIYLRALAAYARDLRPWDRALRQNWWRLWQRFRAESVRADTAAPRGGAGSEAWHRLIRETARLPPPAWVRLEGWARWRVWGLRRWLSGSGAEPAA